MSIFPSFKSSCRVLLLLLGLAPLGGCGTTKWSDTSRTATEQLLITSAMDDVIDEFNFYPLSGRKVFIKKDGITCSDSQYLLTILRQQLAANGVLVKDKADEADYILELAPGAVGTNRYELMYGIPKTELPGVLSGGTISSIPEVAIIKRTDQKAQVKLIMWAYNQKTGTIVWQSGTKTKTAHIRDRWFFGIGPITKTSFNKQLEVGSSQLALPDLPTGHYTSGNEKPSVQTEAVYCEIDQTSLDSLEKVRKEGRFRLQKENEEEKESTGKTDSKASKTDKKSDKKDDPQTVSIKGTEKSPPAVAHSGKTSSEKIASVPANTGQVPGSSPQPIAPVPGEAPPVLQFDNMQLSLESTWVPERR